jgi:hypothetical protein
LDLKEEVIKEVNTATSINKGTSIKPFKVWVLKILQNNLMFHTEVEDKNINEAIFSRRVEDMIKKVKVIDGYTCMSGAWSLPLTTPYNIGIPKKFLLLTAFYNEYNPWFGLSIESKKLVYVTKIEFFDKLEIETINKKFLLLLRLFS